MAGRDGVFCIADVLRLRGTTLDGADRIRQPAEKAGRQAPTFLEEDAGISGEIVNHNNQRLVPPVIAMRGTRPAAAKNVRTRPVFGGFRGWAHQGGAGAAEPQTSNRGGNALRQDRSPGRPARGGRSRRTDRGQRHSVQWPPSGASSRRKPMRSLRPDRERERHYGRSGSPGLRTCNSGHGKVEARRCSLNIRMHRTIVSCGRPSAL